MSHVADARCVLSDDLFVLVEGAYRKASVDEILRQARLELNLRVRRGALLNSPQAVKDYLALQLGHLDHEVFAVLFLDCQNRLIEYREMFRGTLSQTRVYPREVARECLELNASAVLVAHNHPSGLADPSRSDEHLTSALKSALELLDIQLLDHFVVAGGRAESFAERGLL